MIESPIENLMASNSCFVVLSVASMNTRHPSTCELSRCSLCRARTGQSRLRSDAGVGMSFLRLLRFFNLGFQILDELLKVFSAAQRFQPRVSAELVGVVESRGDEVGEGLHSAVAESLCIFAGKR